MATPEAAFRIRITCVISPNVLRAGIVMSSSPFSPQELPDVQETLALSANRTSNGIHYGILARADDAEHLCLVTASDRFIVVALGDLVDIHRLDELYYRIHLRPNAPTRIEHHSPGAKPLWRSLEKPKIQEEDVPHGLFRLLPGSPTPGGAEDQAGLKAGATIEGAAKVFMRSCDGNQSYDNNCAHFLSNAFIKAGFAELVSPNECVGARCNKEGCTISPYLSRRPIRAKDLKCWFQSKARESSTSVNAGSGFWAVYQERGSDGQGHVAILDANAWKFYGTGWFHTNDPEGWSHRYFKW